MKLPTYLEVLNKKILSERRKKYFKKTGWFIIFSTVFLLLSLSALNLFVRYNKPEIISYLFKNSGIKADFRSVSLSAPDKVIFHKSSFQKENVNVSIRKTSIRVDFPALFKKKGNFIKQITLENPDIVLSKKKESSKTITTNGMSFFLTLPFQNSSLILRNASLKKGGTKITIPLIKTRWYPDSNNMVIFKASVSHRKTKGRLYTKWAKDSGTITGQGAVFSSKNTGTSNHFDLNGFFGKSLKEIHLISKNKIFKTGFMISNKSIEIYYNNSFMNIGKFTKIFHIHPYQYMPALSIQNSIKVFSAASTFKNHFRYKKKNNLETIKLTSRFYYETEGDKQALDLTLLKTNKITVINSYLKKNKGFALGKFFLKKGEMPKAYLILKNFEIGKHLFNDRFYINPVNNQSARLTHSDYNEKKTYKYDIKMASEEILSVKSISTNSPLNLSAEFNKKKQKFKFINASFEGYYLKSTAAILELPLLQQQKLSGDIVYNTQNTDKNGIFKLNLNTHDAISKRKIFSGNIQFSKEHFNVDKILLTANSNIYTLKGSWRNSPSKNNFFLSIQKNKEIEQLSLTGYIRADHEIEGNFKSSLWEKLKLNYTPPPDRESSGALTFEADKIHLGDNLLSLTAVLNPQSKSILSGDFRMENGATATVPFFIKGTYKYKSRSIELNNIVLSDYDLKMKGAGAVYPDEKIYFNINLKQPEGNAELSTKGFLANQSLSSVTMLSGLDLKSLKASRKNPYINGQLRAHIITTGQLNNLNQNIKLYLEKYHYNYWFYNIYAELYKYRSDLEIANLSVFNTLNPEKKKISADSINYKDGKINTENLVVNNFPFLWKVTSPIKFTYDFNKQTGFLRLDDYTLNGKKTGSLYTKIIKTNGIYNLSSPLGNGLAGSFSTNMIDIRYRYNYKNYAFLKKNNTAKNDNIVFYSRKFMLKYLNAYGELFSEEKHRPAKFHYNYNGKTYSNISCFLVFKNTATGIRLDGKLLSQGKIKLTGMETLSENYLFDVTVKNSVFYSENVFIETDDCTTYLEGELDMEDLTTIKEMNLRIRNIGKKGIPVNFVIDKNHIDGEIGQADLYIKGSLTYPEVTGDVTFSDTTLTYNAAEQVKVLPDFAKKNDFMERIDWDINIHIGEKCRFYSPMLECRLAPGKTLLFSGTSWNENYSLNGTIEAQSGIYIHIGVEFIIDSLTFHFTRNDPTLNPLVQLKGEKKIRDEKQNKTVTIIAEKNSKLNDKDLITFRSDPPHSQLQILSYLGFSSKKKNQSSKTALKFSTKLVSDNILQPIERKIRKTFKLDYLSIDANINEIKQNNKKDPMDGFYVSKANAALSIGKYFGKNLFFESGVNYAYRDTGYNFSGNLDFEYDLQLFNIEGGIKIKDFSVPGESIEASIGIDRKWQF